MVQIHNEYFERIESLSTNYTLLFIFGFLVLILSLMDPASGFFTVLLIIVLLAWSYYAYNKAEEEIQKTFPICPVCGSYKLMGVLSAGKITNNIVYCENCGAEWKLSLSPSGKLKQVMLITPGEYGSAELVGKKKSPEFWISLSKQRHPDLWHTMSKTSNQFSSSQPSLDSIIQNIDENIKEGDVAYEKGNYTAATNLYFKALVGVCDYMLLKRGGIKPNNHKERFELLKSIDPTLHRIARKFFGIYRKAYSENISKEECDELRDIVFSLIESYSIPLPSRQRKMDSKNTLYASREKASLTSSGSLMNSVNDFKGKLRTSGTSEMSIQEVKTLLKELKSLYDEGLITEEEYKQKKKKLLSKI
ncbi:SHOCT domain-containing protein [Thermococcus sp.]|uniref:SHOCT domain-containing protein n=1 Tax=Thermococcus sp. TaxID=35749 RepID=UPI0026181548|nr:SHOCT domain-containing protein [Thermococcus sp.]